MFICTNVLLSGMLNQCLSYFQVFVCNSKESVATINNKQLHSMLKAESILHVAHQK